MPNKVFDHLAEHRNMPLESATSLIMRTYEQWLADNGGPATDAEASDRPSLAGRPMAAPTDLKQPDSNIVRMLQMVIDGRCLVVEELDEIISYLQQQRNVMAKAQGVASASGLCLI